MEYNQKTVVLIQPPASFRIQGNSVLYTQFDAVGLLALAQYLESQGYRPRIFNFARALEIGYQPRELFQMIADCDPLLFGISMNWLHLSQGALEIAMILKKRHPGLPVVAGGQHATIFAQEIMIGYHHLFDGVVVGEGEETLLEVVARTIRHQYLHGVPGLMTFQEENIRFTNRKITLPVANLPLLSYENVFPTPSPLDRTSYYAALHTTRGGCRKNCNYCLESCSMGTFGREKSICLPVEHLVEQVKYFIEQGRSWITIQDQFCTHGDKPALDFFEELIRQEIRLDHLSIFLEPGCYSRDVYDVMEKLPVTELVISFGIETGSPKVARNLHRLHDYEQIYRELEYLSSKPFACSSWWMVGLPEEGREETQSTQQMILDTMKMGILPQGVTPLILFPQTELAQEGGKFGIRQILKSFDDFKRFSLTVRNQYGVYPELITHESDCQPAGDTLVYIAEIKQEIEKNNSLLDVKNKGKIGGFSFGRFRKSSFF
jgi:radical SAM superfamily enzyme YgiQ (UPF0313 family)